MSLTHSPGLYVHVPFCKSKCPYCDFYSVTDQALIPAYVQAMEKEAGLYREAFGAFDSLYLGGGTPSWLEASQLTTLLALVRRNFDFAEDTEFTLEANPDDITADKLRLFRELGVNRLSLGVQSLDEAELRFLGRRHTAGQARKSLELARAAGFDHVGVDLIYGVPGQKQEAWVGSLEQVLEFRPEHLSCYQLTLAPDTPLGRRAARGEVTHLGEEAERAFFLLTSRFLVERGYLHYEVSNFAREEEHCCRHNRKYWRHEPYLGLGPGAHSFDGGRRWWNFSSVEQYGSSLEAGKAPRAGEETLTPSQ
ncbi:MAG: radical SAM family heme chaperone HemW, partial [Pseudomonadota bacterium]